MQQALAIAAAIPCLLLAIVSLGFININLGTYEAVSSWGISEAFAEITGTSWNISVFVDCWATGLASLCMGMSFILSPSHRATGKGPQGKGNAREATDAPMLSDRSI